MTACVRDAAEKESDPGRLSKRFGNQYADAVLRDDRQRNAETDDERAAARRCDSPEVCTEAERCKEHQQQQVARRNVEAHVDQTAAAQSREHQR